VQSIVVLRPEDGRGRRRHFDKREKRAVMQLLNRESRETEARDLVVAVKKVATTHTASKSSSVTVNAGETAGLTA
jgi:hypothetical protein